jgi:hypothetical protein
VFEPEERLRVQKVEGPVATVMLENAKLQLVNAHGAGCLQVRRRACGPCPVARAGGAKGYALLLAHESYLLAASWVNSTGCTPLQLRLR